MQVKVVAKAEARKGRVAEEGDVLKFPYERAQAATWQTNEFAPLWRYTRVPVTHVRLVSGHHSPTKTFDVREV